MAQGDFYEFGVSYPLVNPKFRMPTVVSTTLSTAAAVAAITISLPAEAGSGITAGRIGDIVQKGDRLILGANSSGVSESAQVASVSGTTTITLTTGLTNAFQSGNTVILHGTRMAGGWGRLEDATETNRVLPLTIRPFDGGLRWRYGQVFRSGSTHSGQVEGILQELTIGLLEEFTYYRFGCRYRYEVNDVSGGSRLLWSMNDGSIVVGLPLQTIATADTFAWAQFASTGAFVRNLRVGNGGGAVVTDVLMQLALGDTGVAWICEPFLEHARGTNPHTRIKQAINNGGAIWGLDLYDSIGSSNFDVVIGDEIAVSTGQNHALLTILGVSTSTVAANFISGSTSALVQDAEIQKKNDGHFVMTDTHPLQSSLDYFKASTIRQTSLGDGSGKMFSPIQDGDRSDSWFFRCRYTVVPQSQWDAFMILLSWQDRGNLINFHPFIDDLPSVMAGRLEIRNVSKATHFSLTNRDFDLTFREMSI